MPYQPAKRWFTFEVDVSINSTICESLKSDLFADFKPPANYCPSSAICLTGTMKNDDLLNEIEEGL
ncbi:hypothetical protein H663_001340 [Limnohabitans planktonicus II-D5]|uniref:Uncharacterized protein n=1 Tax=Limnohabitans planktonicus II-D5 TaxID=1293045 RepID=A0A2T7UJ33_9BURK|nr:hypothetical protein H663_001340 [Limnohabitans planktonicus II-D5]